MVDAARDLTQLQPRFIDAIQQRYELIRPLVLFDEGTPAERVQATNTHPETMRTLLDQFQTQGMLGLALPETDVVPPDQPHRVPEAVRQEIARLKALYPGFHYRELARILFCTFGYRFHHRTVQHHWEQSRVTAPQQLDLWPYHLLSDRVHARSGHDHETALPRVAVGGVVEEVSAVPGERGVVAADQAQAVDGDRPVQHLHVRAVAGFLRHPVCDLAGREARVPEKPEQGERGYREQQPPGHRTSASQSVSASANPTKLGLSVFSRLYSRGWPSSFSTWPPACSSTHCPAAVSHSLVGPSRG